MKLARPLRSYAEVSLGRQRSPQHDVGPYMVPYLRAANVKDGVLDLTDVKSMNFDPREQQVFALEPGDVLITEGSGSLSSVGASAVWRGEITGCVCFQNTLLRLRPREGTDARFLAWWSRYAFGAGLFSSVATGANIFHVSAERVRAMRAPVLSLQEQRRIADYLDLEVARMDELLFAKREMVEVAQARFDSLVFGKVTGQEHPKRLPSGVPWIGSLPAHWGAPALGRHYRSQLGKMLNSEAAAGPELYPYLRNVNVQWDRFDLTDLAAMSFDDQERARCELRSGDLLVCEGGEVGRAAVWPGTPENVYFQKAIHRVRPIRDGNTRFLMYCIKAAASQAVFAVQGNQSTIVHLTGEQLREHRFPFPPLEEQAWIVAELDEAARSLRDTTGVLREQIELLQERRRSLITAVVTGEMEVP